MRQVQVLAFIDRHVRARGFPPTLREVGAAVGVTYVRATQVLAELDAIGCLRKTPNVARGLALTDVGRAVLDDLAPIRDDEK